MMTKQANLVGQTLPVSGRSIPQTAGRSVVARAQQEEVWNGLWYPAVS